MDPESDIRSAAAAAKRAVHAVRMLLLSVRTGDCSPAEFRVQLDELYDALSLMMTISGEVHEWFNSVAVGQGFGEFFRSNSVAVAQALLEALVRDIHGAAHGPIPLGSAGEGDGRIGPGAASDGLFLRLRGDGSSPLSGYPSLAETWRLDAAIDQERARLLLAGVPGPGSGHPARSQPGHPVNTGHPAADREGGLGLDQRHVSHRIDGETAPAADQGAVSATPAPSPYPTPGSAVANPKRSTERGEGRVKLIAALTRHHKYADGGCLEWEAIGNNQLARLADVSASTASTFFEEEFKGHAKYRAACAHGGNLITALRSLNSGFAVHQLFGSTPPGDRERDDDE